MAISQITFYPNGLQYYGFNKSTYPQMNGQNYACSGGQTTGRLYDLTDNRNSALLTVGTNGEDTEFNIKHVNTSEISGANFIVLDNHNLKTANAKIIVDDVYTVLPIVPISSKSGTLGSALANDTIYGDAFIPSQNGITLAKLPATDIKATKGFEVNFRMVGSTFSANITLGELVLGKSFTPSVNPEYGEAFEFGYANDGLSLYTNKSGRRFVSHFHSERRFWKLDFNCVTESELAEFRRIFQITRGYPLYVSFDSDSNTPTVYRVRIVNSYNAIPIAAGLYEVVVEMEEEL